MTQSRESSGRLLDGPACSSGVAVSRRRGISPSVIAIEHRRHLERSPAQPGHDRRMTSQADGKEDYTRGDGGCTHLNDTRFFVIVTGLALVTLLLTFILFRFLQSQAEGQGKLLGGTIKYGGSLAGFVLIFSILFGAFYRLRVDPGVTTPISLAGQWSMELRTSKASIETGVVTIRQRRGDPVPPDGWGGHGRQSDNIHHGGRRDS